MSQPEQPPPTSYKRLVRSRADRKLGGVCAGVAQYTGLDPTLVRVGVVVLGVMTFPVSVAVYALLWAIVPEQ